MHRKIGRWKFIKKIPTYQTHRHRPHSANGEKRRRTKKRWKKLCECISFNWVIAWWLEIMLFKLHWPMMFIACLAWLHYNSESKSVQWHSLRNVYVCKLKRRMKNFRSDIACKQSIEWWKNTPHRNAMRHWMSEQFLDKWPSPLLCPSFIVR